MWNEDLKIGRSSDRSIQINVEIGKMDESSSQMDNNIR